MPTILADKATIFMRVPTVELESEVIGKAQMFGFVVMEDAVLVSRGEGELVKKLTIYSERVNRTDFARLVNEIVILLGKAGNQSVLVETNGVGGLYKGGVDYEPTATVEADAKSSI